MKDEKISIIMRRSIRILSELHSSKAPTLITENDLLCPDLADIYDEEVEQRRIQILEGIAKGEGDINEGRCFTDRAARDRLKSWLVPWNVMGDVPFAGVTVSRWGDVPSLGLLFKHCKC